MIKTDHAPIIGAHGMGIWTPGAIHIGANKKQDSDIIDLTQPQLDPASRIPARRTTTRQQTVL